MAAAGEDERYKVVSFYKFGRSEWTESWWMERRDLNCRIGFFKMSRVPRKYLEHAKNISFFWLAWGCGRWGRWRRWPQGRWRGSPPAARTCPSGCCCTCSTVQYSTVQCSTVPASGSHYNQEGNYPDSYINISTSTYKFIHERWITQFSQRIFSFNDLIVPKFLKSCSNKIHNSHYTVIISSQNTLYLMP